ncbi:MAG: hypothetical protein K9J12_10355 [Melioribacteraceae bacterium]|nr:hypothetical protein [Melioribacteraceae bacterium]MCF8264853.1 hypothetical protein [Melioribacteraceae bacterium]MCF8414573.1 hypothetical protein [Melioribacteraceae bacterium]MCF8431573.1 hypothetical protein [Melioribacteraceae bacterium]
MTYKKSLIRLVLVTILVLPVLNSAQIREYRIHDRGMLHETLFNTGEIGRGWMTGQAGNVTNVPLMEWPSRSKTIVQGIEYSGQHNLLGAGVYIAANEDGLPGKDNRIYAFCGGVGASAPEVVFGRWSFPYYINETENFPLLDDGSLNPDYDPNEAEEIIEAAWASSVGISVKRTSRAWSYPDYDDMIIYEYEFVYNGDTDGNPETIERTTKLKDVMIVLIYGFAPSMYGYQRHYQEWKYDAGIYRGDQHNFWDADYWLGFNLTTHTGSSDFSSQFLAAKPEPNPNLFKQYAETGLNGGGLASPQAPGYAMLYYDTNHLAVVSPTNADSNESEAVSILRTVGGQFYELDENGHFKQPWSNKVSTGNTRSSKMMDQSINPDSRWSGVYSDGSTTWSKVPRDNPRWYGRAAFNYRQSIDAGQKHMTYGPYTIELGDTLRFAVAEVVGYGAQANKLVEGGPSGVAGQLVQWNRTPNWNKKVVINGETLTENYLDDYGYPDYVNSDVKTVTQVAHNAHKAYLGQEPVLPIWPEDNPPKGDYRIPVPVPAPKISLSNTADGNVMLNWNRNAENFSHPRLMGALDKYIVLKSIAGMGPWNDTVAVLMKNDVDENNEYTIIDDDPDYKIGETRYYSVISVDVNGNTSGKTNITKFDKNVGSVDKLGTVQAVPNPFISKSGFQGSGEVNDQIGFYGLPEKCTIRIFSYSGQLIEEIEHDAPLYTTAWFQVTRNGQDVASGIYFFVVTTPNGENYKGKFVIIK